MPHFPAFSPLPSGWCLAARAATQGRARSVMKSEVSVGPGGRAGDPSLADDVGRGWPLPFPSAFVSLFSVVCFSPSAFFPFFLFLFLFLLLSWFLGAACPALAKPSGVSSSAAGETVIEREPHLLAPRTALRGTRERGPRVRAVFWNRRTPPYIYVCFPDRKENSFLMMVFSSLFLLAWLPLATPGSFPLLPSGPSRAGIRPLL